MSYKEEREQALAMVSKKTGLTSDQIELLTEVMNSVWQYIGDDCLVDDDGRPDVRKTIRRSVVVELVTDAGRMESIGVGESYKEEEKKAAALAAIKAYYALPDKKRKVLDKFAFPHDRYGW